MDLRVHPGQSSAQPPVNLLQVVRSVGEGELQLPQTAELLLEPLEAQADPFCPLKAQNKVKPGCLSAQRLLLQKRLPVRRLRLRSLPARAAGCTHLGSRGPGSQARVANVQLCAIVLLLHCLLHCMLHCNYAALCAICCCCTVCCTVCNVLLLHCMLHCMLHCLLHCLQSAAAAYCLLQETVVTTQPQLPKICAGTACRGYLS